MEKCDIRGPLSLFTLWELHKGPCNGAELSAGIEKRKGTKPSPGTIYPILKEFKEEGLIRADAQGRYTLTADGKKKLKAHLRMLFQMLYDIKEMERFVKK